MQVFNKVMPNEEQMKGFMSPGHDGPIYMLNLLKFKEKAEYPDGRETNLSGAEAYAIYGGEVVEHLAKGGGKPIFSARVERLMPGEVDNNPLVFTEPVYKLTARLHDQTVFASGNNLPLLPGMTFNAVIVLGERTFLEWLLNPIYALRGQLL